METFTPLSAYILIVFEHFMELALKGFTVTFNPSSYQQQELLTKLFFVK